MIGRTLATSLKDKTLKTLALENPLEERLILLVV
jgi:hypothetical protein